MVFHSLRALENKPLGPTADCLPVGLPPLISFGMLRVGGWLDLWSQSDAAWTGS